MSDESQNPRIPAPRPVAKEDQSPTIRTTPVGLAPELLPDQAALYVAPQPTPRTSEHKTIDMVPVRLAPEINPRNALTRRLAAAPARRPRSRLVLSGVIAALVLALLALGTKRLLERRSSFGAPLEPVLPAAAAIKEPALEAPEPVASPQASEPERGAPTVAPRRAVPSAAPKSAATGREVWLD